MSYQYLEVRYPTGKYIAETGHQTGTLFWDNIFYENAYMAGLDKDQNKLIAKKRLRQLMSIYQKQTEYIECPVCRQQFEEPDWDGWFIDGNHDLCPSCLFQYDQLSGTEQERFRQQYKGVQI